tara:strand:+ start:930 stop:1184 length:255 start_codon:yes stop_codon:yes gene_type:complete
MSAARNRAYQAAVANPFLFLQEHFGLVPQTPRKAVLKRFAKFGMTTGVHGKAVEGAVDDFRKEKKVAPFVLQAASAKMADEYEV